MAECIMFSVHRIDGEWQTRFYDVNGSELKEARYFATDQNDAVLTGQKQTGNSPPPWSREGTFDEVTARMKVAVYEYAPASPKCDDTAVRLIVWEDGTYEVYTATFHFEEWGDAESGPRASLELGFWEPQGQGFGPEVLVSYEDAIAWVKHMTQDADDVEKMRWNACTLSRVTPSACWRIQPAPEAE